MTKVSELVSQNVGDAITNYNTWGGILFNVKTYGAKGDYNPLTSQGTDDTIAILATYNAAKLVNGTVFFPSADYLVTNETILDTPVAIKGERIYGFGVRIYTSANKPIFSVVNGGVAGVTGAVFEGLALYGSSDITKTHQDGIYVNNVNNVTVRDCYFNDLYNSIHVKDTVFYSTVEGCRFFSAMNAFFYGEGTTSPGYQITFNSNISSVSSSKYGFYFDNYGTVTINDLEMSPGNCTDGGVVFVRQATLAGVQQITHSRLEGSLTSSLILLGASGNPVKFLSIVNTYIAGNPSVYAEYVSNIKFDTCYFTGSTDGAAGRNSFSAKYQGDNISFPNCEFQVTNVPLTAGSGALSISYDVVNPTYSGALPFIYLPFLSASVVNRISVLGGKIGSNATPIDLPTFSPDKVRINVAGNYQQEEWIAPTFQNSWVNFSGSYSQAGYYKDNDGVVHIRGKIKDGSTTLSAVIFNLPAGYRPALSLTFYQLSNNAGTITPFILDVGAVSGNLVIDPLTVPGNTFLILDGISFKAER